MSKKNYKKRVVALSQIFILVIGIVAISYALGSEVRVVSAQIECTGTTKDTEPRNENGNIVFCYYHTDYEKSKKFTVTGNVNIKSSDGTTYQKFGSEWRYTTSGGATGTVSSSNRGDWIERANEALGKYINLKESVATENDFCIKYEVNGQIKYEVYTRRFTNSRDTKALANPKFYYIAKTSSNHIATDLNNIAYLWKGSNWVKLENQEGTRLESLSTNKACDASRFEEKSITNVEDKSDEILPGSGAIPFDIYNPSSWMGFLPTSTTTEETLPLVVFIGPAEGTRAKWQKAGVKTWKCVNNCKITGEMSDTNLCPDANCANQIKNLCTHYYKSYLLKEGYTEPSGYCNDQNYFVLDSENTKKDSDGDGVADEDDPFPKDGSKWREKDEKETTKETKEQDKTKAPFGLEKSFLGAWGYLVGHIAEGVAWAGIVYGGVKLVGGWFGGDENLVNAAAEALMVGVFAGKSTIGVIQTGAKLLGKTVPAVKDIAWWGIGVGFAVTLWQFRYETQEAIVFECEPWKADTGGQHCNYCNNQGLLSCSEYQCKSLGQSCDIINKGTDKEQCAWINKNDVEFPIIEAWEEALISDSYVYVLQTTGISPPDRGVTIDYTDSTTGCVQAFTPLSFGITLDEPATCKLDTLRKDSFDDMSFSFSGGLSLKEHSYTLSLPGSGGNVSVANDGEHNIYVRCQDANGNSNPANFVFNFCVQQGPDTTPPVIETTYPLNDFPFAFEQESIEIEAYLNEPVRGPEGHVLEGCRWSHLNKDYKDMEGAMDCTDGNSLDDMNAQGLYTCSAVLDGLNDRVKNNFYIRCRDLAGNVNEEPYVYTLQGTQPLVIDWVKPKAGEIIKGSTDAIKVTLEARTSVGYKEGESNCYYKLSSEGEDRYVLFYGDEGYSNYEHSQDLYPTEGDYEYDIKCIDLGGNEDVEAVSFSVESDGDAPIIVRAYNEDKVYLKLITNEAARCAYDTKYESYPCDYNFEDGTPMTTIEDINHYADWNIETTFYVKCEDEFGNQPWPDGCSIIVRPSELV